MKLMGTIEVPEEYLQGFPTGALEEVLKNSDDINDFIRQLSAYVIAQGWQAENMTSADFDLSKTVLYQTQTFHPSSLIYRSGFYLQTLLDATFSSNYFTIRKDLRSWMILLTLEGSGTLLYEGKEYFLLPGDIFLIDARRLHEYRAGQDGWHYKLVHYNSNTMDDYFEPIRSNGNVLFHVGLESPVADLMNELFELHAGPMIPAPNQAAEFKSSLILQHIVMELLMTLPEYDHSGMPDWLREIYEFIPEHSSEELTLDTLARRFSVSKYHLSHEFKKHTGTSPIEYVEQCRVRSAKLLLRYSDLTMAQIAEQIGFHDQTTFGRAFKRQEHQSPSEYRKEWKGL